MPTINRSHVKCLDVKNTRMALGLPMISSVTGLRCMVLRNGVARPPASFALLVSKIGLVTTNGGRGRTISSLTLNGNIQSGI